MHAAPPRPTTRRISWGPAAYPHVAPHIRWPDTPRKLTTDSVGHPRNPTNSGDRLLQRALTQSTMTSMRVGSRLAGVCAESSRFRTSKPACVLQTRGADFRSLPSRYNCAFPHVNVGSLHQIHLRVIQCTFAALTCGNTLFPHVVVGFCRGSGRARDAVELSQAQRVWARPLNGGPCSCEVRGANRGSV